MLNKDKQRELAYVVIVDNVTPIEGYDRVELAHVAGWTIVVGKGEFQAGDPAIYFEIDSKLPEVEPFTNMEFLAKKHYKIKTQKMCKSLSQGLLMSAANFGWAVHTRLNIETGETKTYIRDTEDNEYWPNDESRFLTKQLGITYAEPGDNKRKAASADKYKRMAQRHGKLFSHQPYRWLMKRTWGKKLLFVFYGKKRDKKTGWPSWVTKTDEERVENMPYILQDKSPWIATEKIDGTSTTFTIKRKRFGYDFFICSRNVVFDKPDKKCFYETNVYTEMAEKYHIEEVLKNLLYNHFPDAEWVTIQGETFGPTVQKNNYDLKEREFRAFNLITSTLGRLGTLSMVDILQNNMGIPCVPVLNDNYILPDTIEELRDYVNSESSTINGKTKEGIVFRYKDGTKSFKCVSPEYLMKYHS